MSTRPSYLRRLVVACLTLAALAAAPARAQAPDRVDVEVREGEGYARIVLAFPEARAEEPLVSDAAVEHGVLVIRFAEPADLDIEAVRAGLGARAALARLDANGGALRIALRAPARIERSRSYTHVAIDLLGPGRAAEPPVIDSPRAQRERAAAEEARRRAAEAERRANPPPLPLNVRAAEAAEYSRLVFDWTVPVEHEIDVWPGIAEIGFATPAAVDLTRLRVSPPRGMTGIEATTHEGGLDVRMDLADGFTARTWTDGPRVVVDLVPQSQIAAGEETPEGAAGDEDSHARVDRHGVEPAADASAPASPPVAASTHAAVAQPSADPAPSPDAPGPGPVADTDTDTDTDTDAPGEADPTVRDEAAAAPDPAPANGVVQAQVTPIGGAVQAAFRWASPTGAAAFRRGEAIWIVFDAVADLDVSEMHRAGGRHLTHVQALRGDDYSAVRVVAPAATQVSAVADGARWIFLLSEAVADPPAPVRISRQSDGSGPGRLRADLQGATGVASVADPAVGDTLAVATARGPIQGLPARRAFVDVRALASAHGLALQPLADDVTVRVEAGAVVVERDGGLALTPDRSFAAPEAAPSMPGLIDFAGWSGPAAAYVDAEHALSRAVAEAGGGAEEALALARFYVGHELGPEALGVLERLLADHPTYARDARVRAVSGAANVLTNRLDAARADFAAPQLARDPASAVWRGYLAARNRDWREARRQFAEGREAFSLFRSDWRGRFRAAEARAALALNDLGGASQAIAQALADNPPRDVVLALRLAEADYFVSAGDPERALATAQAVAEAGYEPLEAAALHRIVRLERALGRLGDEEVYETLDSLRFRWRGDDAEFDIVGELGRFYIEQGEFRRGLDLMRSAVKRFPGTAGAREMSGEMSALFRRLYIDGDIDRVDPIRGLALWYEFSDLTPVGPDGDYMIRRLADRLVDFDLLDQAAELLTHQVDNRLRGAARAQVATDLATVHLMNGEPEEALNAIRRSRLARLPSALMAERTLIEARALAELGRSDHALELLADQRGVDASRLKASIAWDAKDWEAAGPLLEAAAGEAWRAAGPLTPRVENYVLRAALAYSLAGEADRLARLRERYGARMAAGGEAAGWRIVAEERAADGLRLRDLARSLAQLETLDAFLDDFQARRMSAAEEAAAG